MENKSDIDAFETMRAIAQAHDHDRYLCSVFAPARVRPYIWTLLAFNYEIGRVFEVVSEPMLGEIRLQWWRDAIDEIYAGKPRQHDVVLALAELVKKHPIPKPLFLEMIDARALDLEDGGPKTQKILETYALSTGGALAEACLRLTLGDLLPQQMTAARHSGAAWALTGLLRAVGYHASINQVFIPQQALEAAGIGKDDIYRGDFTPALRSALKTLGSAARNYCASAKKHSAGLKRGQRHVILPSLIASDYLDRMVDADFDLSRVDFEKGRLLRLYKITKAYFLNQL